VPSNLRTAFRHSFLFHWYKNVAAPVEYALWRLRGSPGPKMPHLVKQRAIRQYAREFGLPILVETGTNYAHMIYVQKDHFREIYSIELDPRKAESARRKFTGQPNIHILEGDSGTVLPRLLPALEGPCLFWLDGHDFDISTPVKQELDALFKNPATNHVLLIDDANWFDGRGDYPSLDELRQQIAREYPRRQMQVTDNIIRIYPSRPRPSASR
jgi:hypothetical protein